MNDLLKGIAEVADDYLLGHIPEFKAILRIMRLAFTAYDKESARLEITTTK